MTRGGLLLAWFCALSAVSISAQADPSTPGPAATRTAPELATIGSTKALGATSAGAPREAAPTVAVTQAAKPQAGPRVLRRMNADRVIAALRPAFAACSQKNDPHGSALVVVRANTAGNGDVESTEIVSDGGLPLGVAQCVAERVRQAHFNAPGGTGYSVLVAAPLGR